jgi:hypothetical protein
VRLALTTLACGHPSLTSSNSASVSFGGNNPIALAWSSRAKHPRGVR